MNVRKHELASSLAGFAAVLVAILGIGGASRVVQAIVALLVASAVVATLWSRRVPSRKPRVIVLLCVIAGFTALQLVPLPASWLSYLNPAGASLREDGAALLGTSPWSAITLDVPGTLSALCNTLILLGLAVVATRLAAPDRGKLRLLSGIAGACGLTALVVGVHTLLGAERLYGVYTPEQARPSVLGPLLNENHLGCLMAVGTTLALGLALHGPQASRVRVIWIGVAVGCGATALASQSRGAALALVGGLFVALGALIGQRFIGEERGHSRARFTTSTLPIGIVVIAAILVVFYASAGGISQQFERTSFDEINQPRSKIAIWRSTTALIEETPWVGTGRGGFEAAFTRHHPAAAVNSFSHVENEYLQAVVDWGIPAALVIGFVTLRLLLGCFRRWREGALTAGTLGALAVVAIQSSVDFGIELLGVAAPFIVVLATISRAPLHDDGRATLKRSRVIRVLLALALVGAAILLASPITASLEEDRKDLIELEGVSFAALAHAAERHPLDYYTFARAADIASRSRDPRTVRFLNHALRLHPTHPALHQFAARMLLRQGQADQATIEYGLALRTTPAVEGLLREITERLSPQQAARAIPIDLPVTSITKLLRDLDRASVATLWLESILEARPENLEACEALYETASRTKALDAALTASERCENAAPSYTARVNLARMLLRAQRPDRTRAVLQNVENWPGSIETKASGWLVMCAAHAAERRWDDAKRCLRHLSTTSGLSPSQQQELETQLESANELSRSQPR